MSNTNKTDIWMPFYIGDYLSKTTRLSTEQHGAYLLLLMDYWKNGPPPDDDRVLAQITRMSDDAWSNARSILQAFFELSENRWIHSRVEKELQAANTRKETSQSRARAGARARWSKNHATSNAPSNALSNATSTATGNAQAMLDTMLGDASSPSPSPSQIKTKKHSVVERPSDVSEEVWNDYKLSRKAALTKTALTMIANEAKLAGMTLEAALRESTLRGWRGFKASWVVKDHKQPQARVGV